tara:strand:+ start:903 stop:2369 length:1467 start_codon:yes stop_codon:yes gene_type:complete
MFDRVFRDPKAPRTVVVVPSLSVDADVLAKISGVEHYEERMLCMLMLLRYPHARLIYVTSLAIDPSIIDYYLHLLAGVPGRHARRRLHLLSCGDPTIHVPLSRKLLDRPAMLAALREAIIDSDSAHMTCFNATPLERTLAVRLGIPLYACDPELLDLGTKSGSRKLFRESGVDVPDGFEDLRDAHDIAEALATLKQRHPELRRAVVKLNEGFSGDGNALFPFEDVAATAPTIAAALPTRLQFEARAESWDGYIRKFEEMGGIVECFLQSPEIRSPSVQLRIDPRRQVELISTHDQLLGGPSGQVFLGCAFPAASAYRCEIQRLGVKVAEAMRSGGVIGRFSVDFVSVRTPSGWRHFGLEVNLRKGGTTHPYMMLQFLTDGVFDESSGLYHAPTGQPCYYYASDNLQHVEYRGLTPDDLIDIAVDRSLHFHAATQEGVVFHLLGALPEFGKVGIVCIARTRDRANELYQETIRTLDEEAAARATGLSGS